MKLGAMAPPPCALKCFQRRGISRENLLTGSTARMRSLQGTGLLDIFCQNSSPRIHLEKLRIKRVRQFVLGKRFSCSTVSWAAKKLFTLLDLCVSSLRRGHANLLCIVPILTDIHRSGSVSVRCTLGLIISATLINR